MVDGPPLSAPREMAGRLLRTLALPVDEPRSRVAAGAPVPKAVRKRMPMPLVRARVPEKALALPLRSKGVVETVTFTRPSPERVFTLAKARPTRDVLPETVSGLARVKPAMFRPALDRVMGPVPAAVLLPRETVPPVMTVPPV